MTAAPQAWGARRDSSAGASRGLQCTPITRKVRWVSNDEARRGVRGRRLVPGASWVVLILVTTTPWLAGTLGMAADDRVMLLNVAIGIFFVALVARLSVSAAAAYGRRASLVALLVACVLWAIGASLNVGRGLDGVAFPSISEAFYLPAYAAFAAHVLLDVRRSSGSGRQLVGGIAWLESGVMLGGIFCLAGLLLVTTTVSADLDGSAFLIASYPIMLDLALAALVVFQIGAGTRSSSLVSAAPVVGFAALAIGDYGTFRAALTGTYGISDGFVIAYGVGFTALAVTATARWRSVAAVAAADRGNGTLQVAASALAVALLVSRPEGTAGGYATVVAVATLIAAATRLQLALRQARRASEAQRLSLTDDLTGLANRRALLADLDRAVREGAQRSLLLMDLDNFKEVNDSLGHAAGDRVLKAVGQRLQESFGGAGRICRLGGDEFGVLVDETDPSELLRMAGRAREDLGDSLRVEGLTLSLRVSVGIATVGDGILTGLDILRRADIAMYDAKTSRAGTLVYDAARDEFTRDRLVVADELRRALATGQLRLWYQPQVEAVSRRVIGVEGLVRWHHPDKGVLAPVHFLGVARQSALMGAITEVVMQQAVVDARRWSDQGLDLRVSVNCAPPELLGPTVLPALFRAVEDAGLPEDSLVVEVTEDSFASDPELARQTLMGMRDRHIGVAIDDYGTGFSSLAYLRDLPAQELKIDRSFIRTMASDPRSRVIVESTIRMVQAMGLRVVAEGVEDEQTAQELATMGVDVLQGYLVARPMPAADVTGWITRRSTATAAAQAAVG